MKNLLRILIVIIAVAALWQMFSGQQDTLLSDLRPQQGVDAYMKDFTMQAMNADGRPAITVTATDMRHFMEAEHSELEQPDIRFVDSRRSQWRVTADKGSIDDLMQNMELQDNVNIRRDDDAEGLRLLTDAISIDIENQVLRTDRPVKLQQGTTVLTSRGMLLDNRTGTLKLLSQVEGHYALD